MGELILRPYAPGDEIPIVELFQEVFDRPMPMANWRWRFADNPTGRVMIDLAWDGDVLAGHYAVSPVVANIHGRDYMTALSMTTMTHPDYRGRGLFAALAESVYRRMVGDGMAMVWGFPNVFSHRGFVRDLAWVDIHEVPTMRRILAEGKPLPDPPANVQELEGFDARFDLLWETVKGQYPILTRRDARYLTWRFQRHPENTYSVLGNFRGHELAGYAVWKPYGDDVDLVDFLAVDDQVGVSLICGVARQAYQRGVKAINIWSNFTSRFSHELEKVGFRNSEPVTYFGARLFATDLDPHIMFAFRNWHLTMGDSDVY